MRERTRRTASARKNRLHTFFDFVKDQTNLFILEERRRANDIRQRSRGVVVLHRPISAAVGHTGVIDRTPTALLGGSASCGYLGFELGRVDFLDLLLNDLVLCAVWVIHAAASYGMNNEHWCTRVARQRVRECAPSPSAAGSGALGCGAVNAF